MSVAERIAAVVGEGEVAYGIARGLTDAGATVVPSHADETPEATISRAAERGPLAILVTCPRAEPTGKVADLTANAWASAMERGVVFTARACQSAVRTMRPQGYGRIITIAGRDALGARGNAATGAAEAAVISLTRTLALEAAPDGITANCLALGTIDAEWFQSLDEDEQQRLRRLQPGGQLGTPADVAAAVVFFAADRSGYITGQTLYVCGGTSLFSSLSV